MVIAVVDGMGGGIGAQIVTSLREELPSYIDIYALGTNSIATSSMMKAHANKGATGENAIVVSTKSKCDSRTCISSHTKLNDGRSYFEN